MRRRFGLSYAKLEAKGICCQSWKPSLEFLVGARYTDLLDVAMEGRARIQFHQGILAYSAKSPGRCFNKRGPW